MVTLPDGSVMVRWAISANPTSGGA
jgi:hypothetical protein